MASINWVSFIFEEHSNSFKVQCSCDSSFVSLEELCEHTKYLDYEERMNSNIGMPLNITAGFVNKTTHLWIEGQIVELYGEYYKLIEKDTTHFDSSRVVFFKFTPIENFEVAEHHHVYSDSEEEVLTPWVASAYGIFDVTIKIEVYTKGDYCEPSKVYGFTFNELELARKYFTDCQEKTEVFVFGRHLKSEEFLDANTFKKLLLDIYKIEI